MQSMQDPYQMQFVAPVYYTSMMEFDSDDVVPDADARPSTWTAPSMFPVEAEEPRLDEQIGTESDCDVDSPWICTFNEDGRRFVSWGHK
eukprot:110460-Amphidinium_carterae.1